MKEYLNHYNVIYISLNELPRKCESYDQYISRIENRLIQDLIEAYPDCRIGEEDAVWDVLLEIFSTTGKEKFIFVLDEWDFIFHRDFVTEKDNDRMLAATLEGDTRTMAEILAYAHNTETPLFSYNNETELAAIVNLVYLSARDIYDIEREDKAGIGYVDFIFYPRFDRSADCIILELKVDHTPEEAIAQIKSRKYALRFCGRLGEKMRYTGRILAVGIGYSRSGKEHFCKVEIIERERL